MKKTYLIVALLLVFTLTGCTTKPFESKDKDFSFIQTDTLTYIFNNGVTEETLFTYTFGKEFNLFVNEEGTIYNFKNINNYKELSAELKVLLTSFENISYTKDTNTNYNKTIDLSLGATEDDYNYESFKVGSTAVDVNAYITTEEGVNIVVSYTEFTIEDEIYYVPSFIQLFTHVIHSELSHEYLGENNEHIEENAKLINYSHIVVPVPPKSGVEDPYLGMQSTDPKILDEYTRITKTTSNKTGIYELCVEEDQEDCINEKYTILEVQMYELTLSEMYDFYYDNYSGTHNGYDFVFAHNGYTFTIIDIEEKEVRLANNQIVQVVNAKIQVYE